MLSIDGDCSTDVAAGGSCSELYETQNTGIIASVGGAALLITGVILWIKDEPKKPRESSRTAIITPTDGGVMFGLGGTF